GTNRLSKIESILVDLDVPKSFMRSKTRLIRRESFRRLLWEKLENWRWHRPDNALGRAFGHYDFEDNVERALDQMVDKELDAVMLHEQGEHLAGEVLGTAWNEMLLDLGHSPAELMARAVRDHWADCLVTLPSLLESQDAASLHFYIGGLTGMRKVIFPGLLSAYENWHGSNDWQGLAQCISQGARHWSEIAQQMLELYLSEPEQAQLRIKTMVETNPL
ncbi:MAG: Sfum_1244 family protein, partial [Candidatus Thiodiazotropha sp.]